MFREGQFTPQLKLLFHTERINSWLKDGDIYPILIEFDLSNACNQKCKFCCCGYLKNKSILKKDIVYKTIDILAENGVKAINWTGGGEPLMNKELPNIVAYTGYTNIEQGLYTNGALMETWMLPILLTRLTWLRFSIDSATRKTYKKIRGTDDFDKVIANVKMAVEIRNKFNLNCDIGIGFVITKDNYKEIPLFAKLIEETKVDYGQLKPTILTTPHDEKWWKEKVKPILEPIFTKYPKANINLYRFNDVSECQFDKPYSVCYGHYFCPCISADGRVWICNQLREHEGFCIGNIYKNTFDEIWKGAKRQEVIKRIDTKKCPSFCKNGEINKILYNIKHPDKKTHYNFL